MTASNAPLRASGPGGSIYDLGYQGYWGRGSDASTRSARSSRTRCARHTGSVAEGAPRSCRSGSLPCRC